ncbi:PROTEIN HAIKU1 [Salix purpurea]|uniref:PROTEIN HAIKU1 n=1 Tax=Salix purpurea TaxID=77065 RepID=A0A9Q0TI08_SALPP|nr:PROTEIN HAIKU1 [Salix purpurea]
MDNSKNRQSDHLGVNKIGKNIKKSPFHQPNFANNPNRQQPQPQVYNISKNDFRNIVQQLTGSPSQEPLPRPPHNPPKPQSMRLQKIRPPPLTPINRPHIPPPFPAPAVAPPPVPYHNAFVRPGMLPPPSQMGLPSPTMMQPLTHGDSGWANTAESPISAYMRYLQNSIMDPGPWGSQAHHPPPPQGPGQIQPQHQPPSSGLLPNPHLPPVPTRGVNGPAPHMPNLPSPQMNGPLPSPTSQFFLPSPTGYMNLLSPRSPYPTAFSWDSVSSNDTKFRIFTNGSVRGFRSRASTSTFPRFFPIITFRFFPLLKSKMEGSIVHKITLQFAELCVWLGAGTFFVEAYI